MEALRKLEIPKTDSGVKSCDLAIINNKVNDKPVFVATSICRIFPFLRFWAHFFWTAFCTFAGPFSRLLDMQMIDINVGIFMFRFNPTIKKSVQKNRYWR